MVIHLGATWTTIDNNWQTMRCGGRCDQCGERFQSAASATALHNQVISHLSPAALGPMKAQQVRQRSMPPDPAAHAFPRSSTPGPAAPIYHRLRAASVSGAASSNETRRTAEPPSTPWATRAAPAVSTTTEIADFTIDDPDQGVEYWKMRAIRAEAQTDMYKDELRMVRAEADALRERAAAAERELIIRCGDESDRSRSRSASRATSRQPAGATLFALNGIDPWTITAKLFFSTGRDTFRYSTKTWRCNSWRPGRRQMIERISSSSLRDPFRARVQSWLLTRPIVGETLDLLPLDLAEARVMAEARAASAVPVRTAVGAVRQDLTAVSVTLT